MEEFVGWQWFHPEWMKAQNGDKTAFKSANPFDENSIESALFETLLNGRSQ